MEQKALFPTLQNGSLLSCPGMFFLLKVTYSSLFDRKIIYLKNKIGSFKKITVREKANQDRVRAH